MICDAHEGMDDGCGVAHTPGNCEEDASVNPSLILVWAVAQAAPLAQPAQAAQAASTAASDPVAVEGSSGCPDPAQVQALVNDRLAASDGPRAASGWRLLLDDRKAAASSSSIVTGTLVDGAGAAHESKELTVGPTDCDAAALIFASMVERFFRGLGWSSSVPLPAPAVGGDAPSPTSPTPASRRWGFGIDLSGGAATLFGAGTSAHAVAGVALTATSVEAGRLRLDLLGGWPARHRSEALSDGASAHEDTWPIRAALVFSGPGRPVTWQAGIGALITVDQANSRGVVQPGTNRRATLAMGLTTGIIIALGARWSLLAEVAADRHVL